jgi:hypothetical protein
MIARKVEEFARNLSSAAGRNTKRRNELQKVNIIYYFYFYHRVLKVKYLS